MENDSSSTLLTWLRDYASTDSKFHVPTNIDGASYKKLNGRIKTCRDSSGLSDLEWKSLMLYALVKNPLGLTPKHYADINTLLKTVIHYRTWLKEECVTNPRNRLLKETIEAPSSDTDLEYKLIHEHTNRKSRKIQRPI